MLGDALCRFAERSQVTMIEIAKFDAIVEQHAIPQPVETVGKDDLALGALRRSIEVNR